MHSHTQTANTKRSNDETGARGVRIYAQMRPNENDRREIQAVQSDLPLQKQGRLIGPDELHLTLIHFGKADEIYDRLCKETDACREAFDEQLASYVTKTTATLPNESIELNFDGYDLFGPNRTTLVARYTPSEALTALHAKLLGVLVTFFESIGISDPLGFMQNDPNFKFALTCHPHVTLYKGYDGALPRRTLPPTHFEAMNVVY